MSRRLMIIAGEASGDLHGANLLQALRRLAPDLECFGIGGPALRAAGADIRIEAADLSVVGITEVAAKLPRLRMGLNRARAWLARQRPDLLVLIDFPDFNLMVAKTAKQLGVPVLYYVSPQIWAWRSGRIHKIGARIDHMAVILPFEAAFYRRHGIPVTFVGHPLLDDPTPPPASVGDRSAPTVGLLPGSRDREVERLLPVLLEAAHTMARLRPDLRFALSVAPTVDPRQIQHVLRDIKGPAHVATVAGGADRVLAASTAAVAASGTVTLEAAIAGVPTIIVYKVSPLSYRLGRLLIRVPHIGLANLIAERSVMPELIQDAADPQTIAATVLTLLAAPERMADMRRQLAAVRRRLGAPGASRRVAQLALNMMHSNPATARRGGRRRLIHHG